MDPWSGLIFEPATLHRYLYAAEDPVNKIDPTGLDFSLSSSLTALSGAVTVALANFGARIAPAFSQGGPVLGQLFQDIGRYAQTTGFQVLQYYQRVRPGLQVFPDQRAGTRVIDAVLKLGDRTAWLEMKYGLPWKWGEPLVRLVDQVKQALATGEGEVIVWSLKEPVVRQLNLVKDALGNDATRVRLVHGVQGLWTWLVEFFGPV
jgi:hypothetical protein